MIKTLIQQPKKFYYLVRKEGLFRAVEIMFAKLYYIFTVKKQVDHWKAHRPAIVKNRLVFYSSIDYSDNARVLSDYLVANGYLKDHEIIWLVKDPSKYKELERENLTFIEETYRKSGLRTLSTYESVFTAEKIFFTHSMRWVREEDRIKGQTFINLWHGCGYKSAKGNSENIRFDQVLVPGEVFVKTKTEFFQCESEKILPLGYPRYDLLIEPTDKGRLFMNQFKQYQTDKVIFWMPTYRKSDNAALSENTLSGQLDIPIIYTQQELRECNLVCKANHVILVLKRHPLQSAYSFGEPLSHIKFMEEEDLSQSGVQLYEAIAWSDALITDYSSIAIDYLLLDKPMAFTLDDYHQYADTRGFVFEAPLDYMPGLHVYHKKEFFDFIQMVHLEEDHWKEERKRVKASTHSPIVGESYCERICRELHI